MGAKRVDQHVGVKKAGDERIFAMLREQRFVIIDGIVEPADRYRQYRAGLVVPQAHRVRKAVLHCCADKHPSLLWRTLETTG